MDISWEQGSDGKEPQKQGTSRGLAIVGRQREEALAILAVYRVWVSLEMPEPTTAKFIENSLAEIHRGMRASWWMFMLRGPALCQQDLTKSSTFGWERAARTLVGNGLMDT